MHLEEAFKLGQRLYADRFMGITFHGPDSKWWNTHEKPDNLMQPIVYADANLGNQYDSYPQVGVVAIIAGGCVQATSKRIKLSADSTAYAEMCASVEGIKVASELTKFARDCWFQVPPPVLLTDSEAALRIGLNVLHPGRRQRHWRVRSDVLVSAIQRKNVLYRKVDTTENLSDLLSKPCGGALFESFAREICGAPPLVVPGTALDIRHQNRVVKEARRQAKHQAKAEERERKAREKYTEHMH
jgi:hypothetical protein